MSDDLHALVTAHERRFLRPARADLDTLALEIDYRGSDPGEQVWARAIAAGAVPAAFANDPDRRFRGSSIGPCPSEAYAALVFASDPQGMLAAETLARELVARFQAWGGPAAHRVVWRLAHNPVAELDVHAPGLGALVPAIEQLQATLGGGERVYELRHPHMRFRPVIDALTWSRRWQAMAPSHANLRELANPLEPWLELMWAGYLLHGVRLGRAGAEPTIELAAPFPPLEHLRPRPKMARAVWSKRLSGLRLACTRGDVGQLRASLPLLAADDEPGQPRLIHFAAYGGPAALEVLAAHGDLQLDARDSDGRTALMLAAALPVSGPAGASKAELDTPISHIVGAASCTWLIAAGAEREARDHQGWTALHWAAANARERSVEALLAGKLDVDAVDHGQRTPAMLAVQVIGRAGEAEALELLMRAGADLDRRDHHGWTVLHYLAATSNSSRDRKLATRLVERGARPSRDRAGRSPADIYAWRRLAAVDGGPFDPRTSVAAGPGRVSVHVEPRLLEPLVDQLEPGPRDPAADADDRLASSGCASTGLDGWRVWADWLDSRGDPRGELVANELAMVGLGGSRRWRTRATIDLLRQRLVSTTHAGLVCADALAPVRDSPIQLDWTHGFVTGARVVAGEGALPHERALEAVRALLELEPLLAKLCVRVNGEPAWRELLAGLRALEPKPRLRRLVLEGLPAQLPELDDLPRLFPRLRSLHLIGHAKLHTGRVRWPGLYVDPLSGSRRPSPGDNFTTSGLTHLRVRHGTASEWVQGNVALAFDVPQLTHLDMALSIGSRTHDDEVRGAAATLAALGDVAHLRLSPLAQDFAAALLPSPLIPRLRTLELAGVRGSALETIVHRVDVLRGLARVRISVTPIVAAQRERQLEQLRHELPRLEIDGSGRKRPPFSSWR